MQFTGQHPRQGGFLQSNQRTTQRSAAQRGAARRPGVKFFDIGLTRCRTNTSRQRRGACLQRPMLVDAARSAVCFRNNRRVTAKGRRWPDPSPTWLPDFGRSIRTARQPTRGETRDRPGAAGVRGSKKQPVVEAAARADPLFSDPEAGDFTHHDLNGSSGQTKDRRAGG